MSSKTVVSGVRMQASQHVHTEADHIELIKRLNAALATEMICVLRYRRYHFMARGVDADDFLLQSNEVLGHADQIAKRIVQLGGEADFAPECFSHGSHEQYMPGESLRALIEEDQVAERIAMDGYREMIQSITTQDSMTRRMLKEIQAAKQGYAKQLARVMARLP